MKNLYLVIILSFISCPLFSQISIERYDRFAGVGGQLDMAIDSTVTGIDTLGAGPGTSWDFSSLSEEDDVSIEYMVATGTPYATDFPQADYVVYTDIANSPFQSYKYFEDNTTSLTGYGVGYTSSYGIEVMEKYDQPGTYGFPISYQDGYSPYTFVSTIKYVMGSDSVKREVTITGKDTIDAYGTALLPNGNTYNVLRERLTFSETEDIYTKPASGGTWVLQSSNTESEKTFRWYTDDIGGLLVELKVDENGTEADVSDDILVYAMFFEAETPVLAKNGTSQKKFMVYPNPSAGKIKISGPSDDAVITISDISGRVIFTGSEKNIPILRKGIFVLTINDKGLVSNERLLVK